MLPRRRRKPRLSSHSTLTIWRSQEMPMAKPQTGTVATHPDPMMIAWTKRRISPTNQQTRTKTTMQMRMLRLSSSRTCRLNVANSYRVSTPTNHVQSRSESGCNFPLTSPSGHLNARSWRQDDQACQRYTNQIMPLSCSGNFIVAPRSVARRAMTSAKVAD